MINQVWEFVIFEHHQHLRAKDDDLGLFVAGLLSKSLVSENIIRRRGEEREVTQGRGHSSSVGHRSSHQSHSAQLRVSHGVASGE